MIWFLGDDEIQPAVVEFAGEEQLIISAQPSAIPEQVWTQQVHEASRKWKDPMTAVLYLSQTDYDSEATVWQILRRLPNGSKLIYVMRPNSPKVAEGLDHFKDSFISPVVLDSLVHASVLAKLRAA